jgi:cytochrome b561
MAVQIARSMNSWAHANSPYRMLEPRHGFIALIAVVIGVAGLLGASWPRQMLESWINIHVLFGLLLCGLVFVRCRWCVGHSPGRLPRDIRGLTRHLSHTVYLLLYLVIGVREAIGIFNSLSHGGVADFGLFDDHFLNGPDHSNWNPKDDFQLFISSGLIALMFVRVLTFGLWLRTRERIGTTLAQVSRQPP